MKLDNKGWGFTEMIIMSCVILFFLLVAIFYIMRLYSSFNEEPSTGSVNTPSSNEVVTYDSEERLLKDKAISYIEDTYETGIQERIVTVTLDNLVAGGYLSPIYDKKDNSSCTGYALVREENGTYISEAYLKCSHYTSAGYQSWRQGV